MTELTYTVPKVGEGVTTAEPLVGTALTEVKTVVNGKIGAVNIEAKAVGDAAIATNRALLTTNNAYVKKTFTKAEAEAGVEPSATRFAFVSINAGEVLTSFEVGGIKQGQVAQGAGFMIPPGVKWKSLVSIEALTLLL